MRSSRCWLKASRLCGGVGGYTDQPTGRHGALAARLGAARGLHSRPRETELKACDESKAVVRYARHPLDIDEVRQHIEHGKLPTRLAMTWEHRVSFVLAEASRLRTSRCGMQRWMAAARTTAASTPM